MNEIKEAIKPITAFNLWDFLSQIQEAFNEGYRLSDKNEYFPQALVGFYNCTVVKGENAEVENSNQPKPDLEEVTKKKKVVK